MASQGRKQKRIQRKWQKRMAVRLVLVPEKGSWRRVSEFGFSVMFWPFLWATAIFDYVPLLPRHARPLVSPGAWDLVRKKPDGHQIQVIELL